MYGRLAFGGSRSRRTNRPGKNSPKTRLWRPSYYITSWICLFVIAHRRLNSATGFACGIFFQNLRQDKEGLFHGGLVTHPVKHFEQQKHVHVCRTDMGRCSPRGGQRWLEEMHCPICNYAWDELRSKVYDKNEFFFHIIEFCV